MSVIIDHEEIKFCDNRVMFILLELCAGHILGLKCVIATKKASFNCQNVISNELI